MARRAVLGGGSLNPFGGGQVDFGAFNVGPSTAQTKSDAQAAADRSAALTLNAAEIQWNAGQISNESYLAALAAYASSADSGTTTGQNAIARVATYEYRFQRDAIAAQVDSGQTSIESLLAYDRTMLGGLDSGSEEYQQRLGYYQSDQTSLFNEREKALVDQYNKGQMTTAQLNDAYVALGNDGSFEGNRQIRSAVEGRLSDLADRVQSELDSQTVSDYQAGKISPSDFMAYGAQARARYVQGSSQYADWTSRLSDASDRSKESALLYRYGLTQQMINLEKFVQSSGAPKGGTSKTTRTVLGADGQWHTVTSTKATAPSASEVAAYAKRQAEVASAKTQLAALQTKLGTVGGIVSTDTAIRYYQTQLAKFAPGSDEWYAVQGKIDSLGDAKAAEALLGSQGIRISYPARPGAATDGAAAAPGTPAKGGTKAAAAKPAGGIGETGDVTLDAFMTAIAHVESGGRYTAQNKSSGAYGKYQIMPANWAGWAKQYLGDANAAQTPENQEKVVAGKMTDLHKWLGDWRAVAAWWVAGGGKEGATNTQSWSSATTRYVDNVMAGVGKGPTSGSSLHQSAVARATSAVPVGGTSTPMAKAKPAAGKAATGGPLRVITGIEQVPRGGAEPVLQGANFPAGLDSSAFDKFYAQYSAAFASGATEFSVNTGSGTTHYWVGDDVAERADLMRSVDALQIAKTREQMISYAGTGSGATQANAYDNAVEAAAKHAFMILDTFEPSKRGYSPVNAPNPLAEGLATLEQAKAAIKDYVDLGNAAFKKGDVTTAYSYYQLANARATSSDRTLTAFAQRAQADAAAIEKVYGVAPSEALGAEGGKTFASDLARLNTYGPELDTEINAAAPQLTELLKTVKKDAHGQPLQDSEGPGGQLALDPGFHFEISSSGDVKIVPTAVSGIDYTTGKPTTKISGKVNVDYLIGDKTVNAFVDYAVGDVGWVTTDAGQRIPLQGKFYTRKADDGTNETWFEDPFSGKWSRTPIAYSPGSGFKAVLGKDGAPVFTYATATTGTRGGGARSDGFTYSLAFDKATGTYVATRDRPGGFMSDPVHEDLGSLRPGTEASDAFIASGFKRDLTGLTPDDKTFAELNAPFVGGTARQYDQWITAGKTAIAALVPQVARTPAQSQSAAFYSPSGLGSTKPAQVAVTKSPVQNQQASYYSPSGLGSTKPAQTALSPIINPTVGFTIKPNAPSTPVPAGAGPKSVASKPGAKAPTLTPIGGGPKSVASKPGAKPLVLPPLPVSSGGHSLKPL